MHVVIRFWRLGLSGYTIRFQPRSRVLRAGKCVDLSAMSPFIVSTAWHLRRARRVVVGGKTLEALRKNCPFPRRITGIMSTVLSFTKSFKDRRV